MSALVSDGDQHSCVRPDRAGHDKRTGDYRRQSDNDGRRWRLDSNRSPPHLSNQLHASSMKDESALSLNGLSLSKGTSLE